MGSLDNGTFINYALSLLLKKITVPGDYHNQVKAVKEMLMDDMSGIVDSLTDFAVNSASVDYTLESDNEKFADILQRWLNKINIAYKGRIAPGIKEIAKEYFKERWKSSSFPILKVAKWEVGEGGLILPTKMFFIDGEDIWAKEKEEDNDLTLFSYDYYIGKKEEDKYKLEKNCLYARPYGRPFDKYPTPYLIKRGVYHNFQIIKSLKAHQTKVLDQIIPYLTLIKKGSEGLAKNNIKTYSNKELQQVVEDMQDLVDEMKSTKVGDKAVQSPIRATNFDEEIKHLIPDISTMFDSKLFSQAERNILAGLGFIDIAQSISDSRRESVLNPKVFIEEVKSGVEDFKNQILKPLLYEIQEKNKRNKKYMNTKIIVTSSPVRGFMSDNFKQELRLLWKHGQLSDQTYCEMVGEVEFATELHRREREAKNGIDEIMYPHITENKEATGIDLPGDEPEDEDTDENGEPKDRDKIDDKEKFDVSSNQCECLKCGNKLSTDKHCNEINCPKCGGRMRRVGRPGTGRPDKSPNAKGKSEKELVTAPYSKPADLPARIKKNLSPSLQRTFIRIFNNAYKQYENDTKAFRVAWSAIKKIAKKGKNGKWVRKSSRAKLTRSMLEDVLENFWY